jgi:hypothetical protein
MGVTMWVLDLKTAVRAAAPSLAVLCLAAGCSDHPARHEPESGTRTQAQTWVAIEPTQCLTNAWEADWLRQHGGDYDAYPKDYARPGLEPEEIAIITDYYTEHGVVVSETATARDYEARTCAACTCAEGHTMFLLVRDQDVDTMIGFGYRIEAPPGPD